MNEFFLIFSVVLILLSVLPFLKNQHWVFRVPEFIKIQLLILQVTSTIGLILFSERNVFYWLVFSLQLILIIYHLYLLARFTQFYKTRGSGAEHLTTFKVIAANIFQYNKEYNRFKDFIRKENPSVFFTMESNKDWELALRDLEIDYPHSQKVTLENTYGMHLYSKIPFDKVTTHYFIADDVPSIEAHFKTSEGSDMVLFCVHPPPPSPTEEETSKERDGDLLSIARLAKKMNKPTIVMGDFNTVAWSKISKLFRKNSGLIDGRTGRGILASFHAKYWFFRAPLDLVFHSTTIFIKELKVLEYIGSDHFPICCVFSIDKTDSSQEKEVEHITKEEKQETSEIIKNGKEENSANR